MVKRRGRRRKDDWIVGAVIGIVFADACTRSSAARRISREGEDAAVGFQGRAYETQLARSVWLLELADRWSERDPEFAEQLRLKARELQSAEDDLPKQQSRTSS